MEQADESLPDSGSSSRSGMSGGSRSGRKNSKNNKTTKKNKQQKSKQRPELKKGKQSSSPALLSTGDASKKEKKRERRRPSLKGHKQTSSHAILEGTRKSYRNPLLLSSSKDKYKSVLVYDKPKNGQKIKKVETRFQGIWMSDISQHSSPNEFWLFDLGDEPSRETSAARLQGKWGFRPGLDGNFEDFQPEDLWVFPPLTDPPQDFTVRGVWVYPQVKVDTSQFAPGETGFLDVCKSTKITPLDVGGIWRVYFKKIVEVGPEPRQPSSIFQIKVKMASGVTVSLFPFKPTDTIGDIKEKALKRDSNQPTDQSLLFQEEELDESATLESCNIIHGSMLEFEGMKIFVQDWDKNLMEIRVSPEHTIQGIKNQISNAIGVPTDYLRLSFENALLSKENGKLQGYGIHNKDTVRLEPIHFKVKEPNMKDIVVPVRPIDSILDVKKRITKRGGIAVEAQRLLWNGLELDDSPTVIDYKIQHGATLDLSAMQIFVEHWNGKIFEFDVRPNASVFDLKELILATQSIPVIQQHLYFNKFGPLDSEKCLSELYISHGATLQLAAMQVLVRLPDAQEISLTVDPNDLVNDLKVQIELQTGIPLEKQQLTHKNRLLGGGTSLAENRIKHGANLQLTAAGEITIVTSDGQSFSLKANLDDSLGVIRNAINDLGVPTDGRYLCLHGNRLNEKRTLLDNGVRHGFILNLTSMQVYVKEAGDSTFGGVPIDVSPTTTIEDVKILVQDRLGVPIEQQYLSFQGKMLDIKDLTKTLSQCSIGDKGTLVLENFKVYIQTPTGKALIDMDPSFTIATVKRVVEAKFDIPADIQEVYFDGSRFENDALTISQLGIKFKDTLQVGSGDSEYHRGQLSDWQEAMSYDPKPKDGRKSLKKNRKDG